MPRRNDIKKIMLIGSGPIVIGQACEFDYSGTQGVQGAARRGLRGRPGQLESGDDHDRSRARRAHLRRAASPSRCCEKIIARERPDALLPTLGGQTALNLALALASAGILDKYGVELIGASVEAIEKAEDRELFKAAMARIGLSVPRSRLRDARSRKRASFSARSASRRSCARRSRSAAPAAASPTTPRSSTTRCNGRWRSRRAARSSSRESVLGWKEYELEVMRDASRQRRHRLLDRELRSDGRAHRRLDHRRAGADADRQRVPAHARRRRRRHPRDRRRDRRLQRAVRGQPGRRAHGRHRDEPARVALARRWRRRRPAFPSPRSRPSSRSATRSTRSATTSRARRRRRSSRRSTTSSSRSRASPSRSFPAPT